MGSLNYLPVRINHFYRLRVRVSTSGAHMRPSFMNFQIALEESCQWARSITGSRCWRRMSGSKHDFHPHGVCGMFAVLHAADARWNYSSGLNSAECLVTIIVSFIQLTSLLWRPAPQLATSALSEGSIALSFGRVNGLFQKQETTQT